MYRIILTPAALALSLIGLTERSASAQLVPKAQVVNIIAKLRTDINDVARADGVPPMAISRIRKPQVTKPGLWTGTKDGAGSMKRAQRTP